jgi:predicted TPR repeat methyltransferase
MCPDSTPGDPATPSAGEAREGASVEQATMSLAQALELANTLQRQRRWGQAVAIYEQVLAVHPDDANALHYFGLCLFQQGQVDKGVALIRRAIEIAPDFADAHNNLGNVLRKQGLLEEATAAYRRAMELRPDRPDAVNNLGATLKALGRYQEAVEMYERALELDPKHAPAHNNLGNILVLAGRQDLALDYFRQALLLTPYDGLSYYRLGHALYLENRIAEAAEIYRRWLDLEPDRPEPRHLLAACTSEGVPDRAAKEFVASLFDRFAPSFDAVLHSLEYVAPSLVADAIAEVLGTAPDGQRDVLDAGCGTGLSGPLLRPYARRLCGVDLSQRMLAQAQERGCYDELVLSDLVEHLAACPDSYDLVAVVDTLCYFGDLREVTAGFARAMRPGGCLVFTVEMAEASVAPGGFRLHPHGRYSHTEAYLRQALGGAGLDVRLLRVAQLRIEIDPVQGFVVAAVRKA